MLVADLPNRYHVVIDKDARYWYLMYDLPDVELRIRITHTCDADPDRFEFEVRLHGATDFLPVGAGFCAPIEHSVTWSEPADVGEFPDAWRAEFLMLTRLWAEISDRTQIAPASGILRTVE